MDFATLKAKLDEGRLFEETLEGATFQLRLPTDHAWRVLFEKAMDAQRRIIHSLACYGVCEAVITGWSGVTAGHFHAQPAADVVEFSAETRTQLLEYRPDLADDLFNLICRRFVERATRLETARKN